MYGRVEVTTSKPRLRKIGSEVGSASVTSSPQPRSRACRSREPTTAVKKLSTTVGRLGPGARQLGEGAAGLTECRH